MRYVSLGTFPIRRPMHGGQLRANAIHRVLRQHGWETRHIAVDPFRATAADADPGDLTIRMSARFRKKMDRQHRGVDVCASNFIADSWAHRRAIRRVLDDFKPDVIALEQCWLWPVVREYQASGAHDGFAIVYSSHNVEQNFLAQQAALSGRGMDDWNVRQAAEIELDMLAQADLVVAVSEQDAAHFSLRNSNVTLAPNGIWKRDEPTDLGLWASRFSGLRTALFVSSGHPPNVNGFLSMTAPDLGFLSAKERILVVGGAANAIRRDQRFRLSSDINDGRIELLGTQDSATLSALIELADVVMLPILDGGGTNIKTAEALYNRKSIVATSFAFRGYEHFAHDENVGLADNPAEFQDLLLKALRGSPRRVEAQDDERLDALLWTATLRNLPEQLAALPKRSRRLPTKPVNGFGRYFRGLRRWLGSQ